MFKNFIVITITFMFAIFLVFSLGFLVIVIEDMQDDFIKTRELK